MGDIAGDLSSRRGHVTGTTPRGHGTCRHRRRSAAGRDHRLRLALKSVTGGQGAYTIEFARHAQVPPQMQQKLAAQFKLQGRRGVAEAGYIVSPPRTPPGAGGCRGR